jgi:hypothetical protein
MVACWPGATCPSTWPPSENTASTPSTCCRTHLFESSGQARLHAGRRH